MVDFNSPVQQETPFLKENSKARQLSEINEFKLRHNRETSGKPRNKIGSMLSKQRRCYRLAWNLRRGSCSAGKFNASPEHGNSPLKLKSATVKKKVTLLQTLTELQRSNSELQDRLSCMETRMEQLAKDLNQKANEKAQTLLQELKQSENRVFPTIIPPTILKWPKTVCTFNNICPSFFVSLKLGWSGLGRTFLLMVIVFCTGGR